MKIPVSEQIKAIREHRKMLRNSYVFDGCWTEPKMHREWLALGQAADTLSRIQRRRKK